MFINDNDSLTEEIKNFIESDIIEIKNISGYTNIKNHNFKKYKLYLIEESIFSEFKLPNTFRKDNLLIITTESEETHINGYYQINIREVEYRERF